MQQFDKTTGTVIDWNNNTPVRSLKGIVVLFEDVTNQPAFGCNGDSYFNPKVTNVDITIESQPNQIYVQGFKPFMFYDKAAKLMAREDLKHAVLLYNTEGTFLQTMYALVIDFRKTKTHDLHIAGTKLDNGQQGLNLAIARQSIAGCGTINAYIYLIMDAQLVIKDNYLVLKHFKLN